MSLEEALNHNTKAMYHLGELLKVRIAETPPPRKRRTKAQIEADKLKVEDDGDPVLAVLPGGKVVPLGGNEVPLPERPEPAAVPTTKPIEPDDDIMTKNISTAPSYDPSLEPVPVPTVEMLRAEASGVVELDSSEEQKGLAIAQGIITSLGCKMISEIRPEQRQEAIDLFRKAIKEYK